MSATRVTIYALKDPRDGTIRYVGKTKFSPKKRLSCHMADMDGSHRARWIGKLKRLKLTPEILELDSVLEDQWQDAERFWIKYCRLSGIDLTNGTNGGDGVVGLKNARGHRWTSVETEALKQQNLGNCYGVGNRSRKGQKRSPEELLKTSLACSGIPKSDEWREKMRQSKLKYWEQFTKEKRRELLSKSCNSKESITRRSHPRKGKGDDPQ